MYEPTRLQFYFRMSPSLSCSLNYPNVYTHPFKNKANKWSSGQTRILLDTFCLQIYNLYGASRKCLGAEMR